MPVIEIDGAKSNECLVGTGALKPNMLVRMHYASPRWGPRDFIAIILERVPHHLAWEVLVGDEFYTLRYQGEFRSPQWRLINSRQERSATWLHDITSVYEIRHDW